MPEPRPGTDECFVRTRPEGTRGILDPLTEALHVFGCVRAVFSRVA